MCEADTSEISLIAKNNSRKALCSGAWLAVTYLTWLTARYNATPHSLSAFLKCLIILTIDDVVEACNE